MDQSSGRRDLFTACLGSVRTITHLLSISQLFPNILFVPLLVLLPAEGWWWILNVAHVRPGGGRNAAAPDARSQDIDMDLTTSPFEKSTEVTS